MTITRPGSAAAAALTPMNTLCFWAVLARGGEALAKDLKPDLDKPRRDALTAAGLLAAHKGPRGAVRVEVTERGWAWAAANLAAPMPPRSTAGGVVLQDVLARLGRYLDHSGVSLADLLCPPDAAPAAQPLAERLRAAYLAETGGAFGRRARFAALRRQLPDVAPETLEGELNHLLRAGAAVLMPIEDPADITPDDKAAAIHSGNEWKHLLIMDR